MGGVIQTTDRKQELLTPDEAATMLGLFTPQGLPDPAAVHRLAEKQPECLHPTKVRRAGRAVRYWRDEVEAIAAEGRLLTTGEVGKLLRVSSDTVLRMIEEGELPSMGDSRNLVPEAAVDEHLRKLREG